jgi:hypothetical protein
MCSVFYSKRKGVGKRDKEKEKKAEEKEKKAEEKQRKADEREKKAAEKKKGKKQLEGIVEERDLSDEDLFGAD